MEFEKCSDGKFSVDKCKIFLDKLEFKKIGDKSLCFSEKISADGLVSSFRINLLNLDSTERLGPFLLKIHLSNTYE